MDFSTCWHWEWNTYFDTTFHATMGLQDRGAMKPTPCSGPVYTGAFERRSFIQVGVLGGLGLSLADLFCSTARASVVRSEADAVKRTEGRAKSVIQIVFPGGVAH